MQLPNMAKTRQEAQHSQQLCDASNFGAILMNVRPVVKVQAGTTRTGLSLILRGLRRKATIMHQTSKDQEVVVICGSMTHFGRMQQLQLALDSRTVASVVPEEENGLRAASLSPEDFLLYKGAVSERYFRIIRQRSVFAILVANETKGEIANYIGANTLAEIAIAVNARKRIYLLNDYYEPIREELLAWRAIPLLGRVEILVQDVLKERMERKTQLRLDLGGQSFVGQQGD